MKIDWCNSWCNSSSIVYCFVNRARLLADGDVKFLRAFKVMDEVQLRV